MVGKVTSMQLQPAILTMDIGLTNCKAALWDVRGRMLHQAAQRYPTYNPQLDRSEQRLEDWWRALRKCCRAVKDQAHSQNLEIMAISPTAHMHGLVVLDANHQPLTTCWTLFDRRAQSVVPELVSILGERTAYDITGGRLEAYTPAAKIFWLKHHVPEVFHRAACFLAPKDALRVMLGGELVSDPIDAAGMLLFDLGKGCWSPALLEAVGIQTDLLPEVRLPTELAGRLSLEAARQLDLPAGIPLLTGAGDDIEALGAGIVRPGQALEHIGTTGTLIACTDRYVVDPDQAVEIYPHALQGLYLVGGATNAAGRSLDWVRRLISSGQGDRELPLEYADPPRNSGLPLYLPFILGERGLLWDGRATGIFLGLRESHGRAELARATYEGVAFSLREIIEGVQKLGLEIDQLISGSSPVNRDWTQLRADLYGKALHFPAAGDLTGLGAAVVGLAAVGIYPDLQTAAGQCCALAERIEPVPTHVAHYNHQWEKYQAALHLSRQLFLIFA